MTDDKAALLDDVERVAIAICRVIWPKNDPEEIIYSAPTMGDPGGPLGPFWHEYGAAAARAAIAALSPRTEGWVCVPREPTEEMLDAVTKLTLKHAYTLHAPIPWEEGYRLMIAAAPAEQP